MKQLSLFRGVHDTQPRPVTLEELVTMMRTDQSVRDLTEKHRYARSMGDEQGASRYKKMMTSFGVAALFEGGRRQRHIVEYTGLSLADFDHIPEERMPEVLAMVCEDEHTLLAYTTISNHGIRVLYRYDYKPTDDTNCHGFQEDKNSPCSSVLSVGDYKLAFLHGNRYYSELVGLESDGQCKNVGRISTIAYDEELYYNPDATPFIVKLEEKKSVGRPRGVKSEKLRVKSCKVSDVEAAVCKELEQRGVVYRAGTHNKYISDACYMMNRYGVAESDCTAWALDRFADYHEAGNDVASIVRSCYTQTAEHGTARPPKADTGKQATVAQIEAFLAERVALRRNVVTGFVEILPLNEDDDADARGASVNLQFSSFAPRHRLSKLISALGLASVATVARYESATCDEESFSSPEECALAPLGLSAQRSAACSSCLPEENSKQEFSHTDSTDNTDSIYCQQDLNTITQNTRCCARVGHPDGDTKHYTLNSKQKQYRQFTDDDRNSLWRALSKELGVRVVRQDISAVVKSDFSPRYHPFEDYINWLQPWDGVTDHIGRLASSVTVKGDQEYFARCFKKWLVAFIAAIFDPEEVNHEILVFIGRQGSYKSTWFHYLLPPELRQYFLPKLMSNSGITKDDLFKIAQSGLVCLEEIDHMKQRDLNQLKAITTMRTINERRSYGEFNEFHRHIASFCATGNNRFFLTDPTGNRRFLTFEVESIVPPQTYDYGYEGVYAQAYTLWRQGFRYWFNDEENAEINRRNTDFEAPNKEWELINKYYRRPLAGEECKFLTATDILERINASVKERLSIVKIGNALHDLGYERKRLGNARGYRLVEIPFADMERKQKDMGKYTDTPQPEEQETQDHDEEVQTELPF